MFQWTEEQEMVRGAVRQFIDKEIRPRIDEFEHGDTPPYEVLRKMFREFGMDVAARDRFTKQIAFEKSVAAALEAGETPPEKPKRPKGNLASMGVYIFTWPVLKSYLDKDACDPASKNDFGKNVIPAMLHDRLKLKAYAFDGYWKDVGTIESLWEANMDLLKIPPEFNLSDARWPIYARSPVLPPHFIGQRASIEHSMIAEGCEVNGTVRKSVLFYGVEVEKDALVEDSVIMPYARIEAGAVVRRAIVAENCVVAARCAVGEANGDIALVGQDTALPEGCRVLAGEQVDRLDVARRRHDAK